ncbi:site-specific integrase [Paenibacillus alvei]|uniref:tyrosine-type recombinase/integrase n=1 Tax=Paenibacillus alvei TaxID=44250 RepID=UPI0002899B2C|nr:site-specific integrase [Paenibacillus alvei]EJW14040.1 site-specific recombinase XerD [Paenibacillus alvei DSM 29]MCY9545301.1 site-specific integrase [Paenibacillus alvei]MCY9707607.1 site-specific integrase [Paenibacillus alvei]MCY9758350.1 site-specific integrase [Paenibacillus alvei]MEC0082683.1 site-specific integrase [Paenibacillus alvei]
MSNLSLATVNNVAYTYDQKFVSFYEQFIKSQRAENTADAYRTDLTQFFKFTFNREPQFVRISDIEQLTSVDAMAYHNHLKSKKLKNASIKRKISSAREFIKSLKVDYPAINEYIFDNVKLDSVDLDRKGYGNLEWDEAFLFIEYAYIEQMEGNQMAMLLKLASITSIRLEALLTLTWEDDFRTKMEKGVLVNYIDKVDKKTRHQTPISDKFYNELRLMLGTSGKLFPNLYKHKVGLFLKQIREYFEIDPNRNIRFHSFKKCGVNRVLEKTGDLTKAQIQGKHKSIITTQNSYVALKDDLTLKPSYTLDQDINVVDEIKHLSSDELLNAIAQLSDSAQFELLRIINKG